jgi:hypothetical protein
MMVDKAAAKQMKAKSAIHMKRNNHPLISRFIVTSTPILKGVCSKAQSFERRRTVRLEV